MYCQKCMKNMITSHGETCPVCKTQIANANDLRIKAVIRRGRRNQVPLATRILFALFVLTLTTVFIGVFLFQNAIRPSHQTHRLGSPINVRGATIASGSRHAAVIRADGELWAWGLNHVGQLGDGTTENRYEPIHVMDNVVSVVAGVFYTMFIKADSSLWVWGDRSGWLAGNSLDDLLLEPTHVLDNVVDVSNIAGSMLALKSDGSLWGWGHFSYPLLRVGLEYPPLDAEDFYDYFHIPDGLTVIPTKIMDNIMLP